MTQEEKKLPDGLEEAAEKCIDKALFKLSYDDEDNIEQYVYDAFIAGAEWGMNQCPLPEDTTIFMKGVAEGKRLMMEEAVEGKIAERVQGKLYARCQIPNTMGVEFGDKVRVIVIKEDEK